jgi:hypothetical protein
MRIFLIVFSVLAVMSCSFAGDWPGFRGPGLDGVSSEKHLPGRLDSSTQLWKCPLPGPGEATAVTSGGRVSLTGSERESKALFALCVDSADGEPQIVLYGGDYITGHDPAKGTELWRGTIFPKRN